MTDLLITNDALVQMSLGIAVIAVGLVALLAVMVGARMTWGHYRQHLTEWATADVRERNKDLIARGAEKDREIERLRDVIRHKDERLRSMTATVRGAQVQAGNVAELLTLSNVEAGLD